MKLLVIVLNKENFLDDILSSLVELGVMGATVIESTRMSEILAREIPIFAGLRQMRREGQSLQSRDNCSRREKRDTQGTVKSS